MGFFLTKLRRYFPPISIFVLWSTVLYVFYPTVSQQHLLSSFCPLLPPIYSSFSFSLSAITPFFTHSLTQPFTLPLHPPAPQSISSPLKPQALFSVVKPLSEPLSKESDRQTERNKPRKNTVDSSLRWVEVSLLLFKVCMRKRRKRWIDGRQFLNIWAAITHSTCTSQKPNISWS